ncbi:MAG: hypothetical protein A4E74_02403 [Syntrophus sp. PtaB.Bin075]|nr:MAG: hypothetical protein A4E74_02403 [Syntrophus sp. PtaB.Bin075]
MLPELPGQPRRTRIGLIAAFRVFFLKAAAHTDKVRLVMPVLLKKGAPCDLQAERPETFAQLRRQQGNAQIGGKPMAFIFPPVTFRVIPVEVIFQIEKAISGKQPDPAQICPGAHGIADAFIVVHFLIEVILFIATGKDLQDMIRIDKEAHRRTGGEIIEIMFVAGIGVRLGIGIGIRP